MYSFTVTWLSFDRLGSGGQASNSQKYLRIASRNIDFRLFLSDKAGTEYIKLSPVNLFIRFHYYYYYVFAYMAPALFLSNRQKPVLPYAVL